MKRNPLADRDIIMTSLAALETAAANLRACSFDALTAEELVSVLARQEKLAWQAPVVQQRIIARLAGEGHADALGECSVTRLLTNRLRISESAARRRVDEAAELGPRTALTGEPLAPLLPALAAAQAAGRIGPENMEIARRAMGRIADAVGGPERTRAEHDLAVLAAGFGPAPFRRLAEHLVAVLSPDGRLTDRQRQARRGLRLGRPRSDGLSSISGQLSPELRATLEPILAKLGAPGMCNAADEQPCVSGTPSQEQIQHDDRTPDQRNHDALLAAARMALAAGELGQLNGLPVTVIVTTTLAELQAAAEHGSDTVSPPAPPHGGPRLTGKAYTAGGSLLPMGDLLRMAAHAYHYLALFDGRGRALWLGRSKRIATADQRIVLHARDRGCTRPGCTVSGYLSQAHHLEHDWADDGRTDVDTLGLACAPDNKTATRQGWTTVLGDNGRVEWIPPPHLDRGQPRINPFHFIESVIDYHRGSTTAPDSAGGQPPDARPGPGRPALVDELPADWLWPADAPRFDDSPCSVHPPWPGDPPWAGAPPWPGEAPWAVDTARPDDPQPDDPDYAAALDDRDRSLAALIGAVDLDTCPP